MADPAPPPNAFQKITNWFKETVEWIEETFGDAEVARSIREDLGLDGTNPATPQPIDPQNRSKIDEFVAKQKVDEQAFIQTISEIVALVQTGLVFADAVKTEGVDEWDVFWLLFKVWLADSLRLRNPSAYALCEIAGFITEDEDTIGQLDPVPLGKLLRGKATEDDSEALVQRLSAVAGSTIVALEVAVKAIDGAIDAVYGWDPEPDEDIESALVAERALTVVFHLPSLDSVKPALTLIGVPRSHGGPGVLVSLSAALVVENTVGPTTYTFELGAGGALSLFIAKTPRVLAGVNPMLRVKAEPSAGVPPGTPALLVGTSDSSRLEIGALAYGVELSGDSAGFHVTARHGKLVIVLGDGDGFLRMLPGGTVEVPFDLGLLADTRNGVRFDGGTGLSVNLPIAASLFGLFTVQFIELELKLQQAPMLDLRGGFSLKLGPFKASVDRIGVGLQLEPLFKGVDDLGQLVKFEPPKGIGLSLDAGVVKGGGYLFIDAEKGEYAGALELKFLTFGIKAIGLLSTKKPDGSEGWSLLLFVFGQFKIHIAFGIFWTGLGGMIGLHHRADLDALTAGMRTGALDDILFPDDPVADAPRIINRYRTLFPIEQDTLLLGPMLELSFSEPPIVYIRLGLIFEVRNALGGDRPPTLTKVILLGQLLVQLPPKETGVPAILKLLVDVVGFYDAQEQFLMIRARLRDSFVGIEGFAKLNLSGELLLAMHFGSDPSFVLSAGGFHPAFKDLPPKVPGDLDRLAVSFNIGIVKFRSEQYFAVTSNSVQGGMKVELSGDIDVAVIKGWLSFDALLYLTPKFHFIVELKFGVSVRAFGTNIGSVTVEMSLEGPGEWHARGSFSFSILWWDVSIGFNETWGSAPEIDAGTTSAAQALMAELNDPARLQPGGPVSGVSHVSLAPVEGAGLPLAHPLGQLAVRQKAVPFEVRIDRLGTKKLTEGTPTFSVTSVKVGGVPATGTAPVTDHFARGQFMELTEKDRLGGKSFEQFPCGVAIGTDTFTVPAAGSDVKVVYERKILEPDQSTSMFGHWRVVATIKSSVNFDLASQAAHLGAAARSERAVAASLHADGIGAVSVRQPALAAIDEHFDQPLSLIGNATTSTASAVQALEGVHSAVVIEAYEMTGA